MNDPTLPLPGLSPVARKSVVAKFDGGLLSSDGGILALREIEQRLRVADRFAACIDDPRAPDQITHTLADIIRFRLLMIAAGYDTKGSPALLVERKQSESCDPVGSKRSFGQPCLLLPVRDRGGAKIDKGAALQDVAAPHWP